MIADYKQTSRLVFAVQRVLDAVHGNRAIDADDAGDVCAAARDVLGLYEDSDETRADLAMLDMLSALARRALTENDAVLAADLEDARARMAVHVARRIVERLTGESTALERALRGSLHAVEERGAKLAEITRWAFPSELVGKGA